MKLAIVTTHPIQYNAPWFKLLAEQPGIDIKVFYTWEQANTNTKFDPGFGKMVSWDIPLLDGYEYTFVKNTSDSPGSHHYKGIINPTLNEEIKTWGAEAVLVFGWPFKSHLACMRHFKGRIPVLFRGDSTLLNEQPGVKRILRRLFLRYVYSFVDYALYVGSNNKNYFLAHGLKEKQLVFVPHAIDNDRFWSESGRLEREALDWRARLGITNDMFVVLYTGKFDTVKNPAYILDIAKKLPGDNFRFILVGNGPLENELKTGLNDDRIIFIDFQNQQLMPVVYRLGNVIVMSSKSETWGLAVNEAMACNRPVITNNKVGCAVDLIQPSLNGIITSFGEVDGAIDFIRYLDNNDSTATISSVNKKLLGIYSFRNIVSSITGLLHNIYNRRNFGDSK